MSKPNFVPPSVTPRSTGDFRVIPETPRASMAIDAAVTAQTTQPHGAHAQPGVTQTGYQAPEIRRAVTDGDLSQPMELDEFLNGLGVVMRLPPRRPTTTAMPVVVAPKARAWGMAVLALCALAALVYTALGLLPTRSDPLPADFIGVWETANPKYAGRRFEIKETSLVLQTGEGAAAHRVFPISRVQRTPSGAEIWYTITYDDDGAPQTFVVSARDGSSGAIRVKNQNDIVWVRK